MSCLRLCALLLLAIAGTCDKAAASDPAQATRDATLRPGEFVWEPALSASGPVMVIVSLDEQRAYVYRDGVAIGVSTISSGRERYETPSGVFTILQKEREHYSNRYDNAPMPFMERLTWDGIALHGGAIPGYPASHGCVRLPGPFAERLFAVTKVGTTVIVTRTRVLPDRGASPVPFTAVAGDVHSIDAEAFAWDEAALPEGPVSILVGIRDRSVRVLRNGIEIGSARLGIEPGFRLDAPHLFVIGEGLDDAPSPLDPAQPAHRWSGYAIAAPGRSSMLAPGSLASRLRVPAAFAQRLYTVLEPGTTIMLTDLPSDESGDASRQTIIEAEDDQPGRPH